MLLTDFLLIFPDLNILFVTWNDRNRANTHRFRVTDKCWVLYNLVLAGGWLIWSVLQKIRNSRCCLKILFWKNKFITNCLSKMLCAFYQVVGIHSSFRGVNNYEIMKKIIVLALRCIELKLNCYTWHRSEIEVLYAALIYHWTIIQCIDLTLSNYPMHRSDIELLYSTLHWSEIKLFLHCNDLKLWYYTCIGSDFELLKIALIWDWVVLHCIWRSFSCCTQCTV